MKKLKRICCVCVHTLLYLKTCSFRYLNKVSQSRILNFCWNHGILYSTMCHLNLCIKKKGITELVRRKWPVISLNCFVFIENLSSSKGACACALVTHKNDAQKGCAMQLKGITLSSVGNRLWFHNRSSIIILCGFSGLQLPWWNWHRQHVSKARLREDPGNEVEFHFDLTLW